MISSKWYGYRGIYEVYGLNWQKLIFNLSYSICIRFCPHEITLHNNTFCHCIMSFVQTRNAWPVGLFIRVCFANNMRVFKYNCKCPIIKFLVSPPLALYRFNRGRCLNGCSDVGLKWTGVRYQRYSWHTISANTTNVTCRSTGRHMATARLRCIHSSTGEYIQL